MPSEEPEVNEQEAAPEVEAAAETEDAAAETNDAAPETDEAAAETVEAAEVPSDVPEVNEQEKAPEVEAYYPGAGGLAGPVQPDYLMPPEPTSPIPPEPCPICGEYECDCEDLRDRRNELRDLGYDLRIQERDAKQRVRDIRA